jgi:hypothetical protein
VIAVPSKTVRHPVKARTGEHAFARRPSLAHHHPAWGRVALFERKAQFTVKLNIAGFTWRNTVEVLIFDVHK